MSSSWNRGIGDVPCPDGIIYNSVVYPKSEAVCEGHRPPTEGVRGDDEPGERVPADGFSQCVHYSSGGCGRVDGALERPKMVDPTPVMSSWLDSLYRSSLEANPSFTAPFRGDYLVAITDNSVLTRLGEA